MLVLFYLLLFYSIHFFAICLVLKRQMKKLPVFHICALVWSLFPLYVFSNGKNIAYKAIKKNLSACLCRESVFQRNKSDLGPIYWPIYEPLSAGRASWAIITPDKTRENLLDVSPHITDTRTQMHRGSGTRGAADERTAQ